MIQNTPKQHKHKTKPRPFCGTKPKLKSGNEISVAGVGSAFGVSIACVSKRCIVKPDIRAYTLFKKNIVQVKLATIQKWNTRKA